jgi:hypothetical protein
MHKKNLLPFILLFAVSCAVRPPLTTETARMTFAGFVTDNGAPVDSMKASGTVAVGQNGEHASVSFDIMWAGDSAFTMQFSTVLGMTIASVKAHGPGTWLVDAADSRSSVSPDSDIAVGQEFLSYPVSWREFISILTGRLPCASLSAFSREPDTHVVERKSITLSWKSIRCGRRDVDVSGKIDNKKQGLTELVYRCSAPDAPGAWTLTARGFTNGHAKEFRFVQANNNYFYVSYRSMKFHSRAMKGK